MIYLATTLIKQPDGYLHFFYQEGMIYRVESNIHSNEKYYVCWKHEIISDNYDCELFKYILPETLNIIGEENDGVEDIDIHDEDMKFYYVLDGVIIDKIINNL